MASGEIETLLPTAAKTPPLVALDRTAGGIVGKPILKIARLHMQNLC
jgi:hypothetical protein